MIVFMCEFMEWLLCLCVRLYGVVIVFVCLWSGCFVYVCVYVYGVVIVFTFVCSGGDGMVIGGGQVLQGSLSTPPAALCHPQRLSHLPRVRPPGHCDGQQRVLLQQEQQW